MPDKDDKPKLTGHKLKDFLEKAQKRLDLAIKADDHNRKAAIEDLKFINGEQWDAAEKQRRSLKKRPALQVNLLPKYINQLVGEQRQNRPKIKVRPVDSKADVNIAKIREGIISNIEYLSRADTIYDMAYSMAVKCGYGGFRILTRYTEENPFEQEIYLEPEPNPFVWYLDPAAKDPCGSDALWGFRLTKMPRTEFEDKYPDADTPSDETYTKTTGISYEHWWDKENVTIAEYFEKKAEKKKIVQFQDGSVHDKDEAEEIIAKWESTVAASSGQMQETAVPQIIKERETEEFKVTQYIISVAEILEQHDWPGQFIPYVPVYGRETNIEGKRYIEGLIRNAKDPQRMFNYWHTSAAETIALAPKSPWVGSAKMFEGYEKDYAAANTDNVPFLKAKHDSNFPGMLPQRQQPTQPPAALFAAITEARQNIMDSLGMYQRDMGDKGPEVSGAAIRQTQKPGDTATFDFYDNLVRSIAHGGMIINDLIPHIYDTERDARLRNNDDTESFVLVNTTAGSALQRMKESPAKYQGIDTDNLQKQINQKGATAKYNDLKSGKYGTVVTTGPTHATQRQESAENLLGLMKTPLGETISKIAPDLVMKNMDFLDADEMAKRLRKILPPGIYEPKQGEKPIPPMPPSPPMQLQMLKMQTEQTKHQKEKMQLQVALVKLYKEMKEGEMNMKQEILNMLAELHADQHPADMAMAQRMLMQQGAMQ